MMDKPSLRLVPIDIDHVTNTILDINKSGISIFRVEQNAGLVTMVSRTCYLLEAGKVVLKGNIKELITIDSVRMAISG